MAGKIGLQILRGDQSTINTNADTVLLYGQPFYNSTDNYLTIGPVSPTGIMYAQPIAVKELHGPTGNNGPDYYILRDEALNAKKLIIRDSNKIDLNVGDSNVVSITEFSASGMGGTARIRGSLIVRDYLQIVPVGIQDLGIFTVDGSGEVKICNNSGVQYQFASAGPMGTTGDAGSNVMLASTGPTGKYYPVLDKATSPTGTQLKWIKEEDLMPAKVAVYSGSSTGTFTGYTIRQMSASEVTGSIPNNSIIYVVD